MRRAIQIIFLVLAVANLSAQNGQSRTLSLAEALEIAKQKSYPVRLAESRVQEMKGGSLESWRSFLPSVTLSENYVKSNDPVTVFGLKLRQGIFTQEDFSLSSLNNPSAIDNFTTALRIQQPILNIDAIYGKSAARNAVAASEAAAQRATEAVTFMVNRAYFGLVVARAKIGAIDKAVESAEAHRNDAKTAVEQGLIHQSDLLAAQVRLGELQEQRISAEHDMLNTSDALKLALGLESEGTIVPTDSLSAQKTNLPELQTKGFARSDLQALRLQTKAARRQLGRQRSTWLPRLNGFAVFEWNASEAFAKDGSNWIAGLQMQWHLFDGLGKLGRSKKASAQWQQSEIALQEAEAKAASDLRKARRAIESAQKRIEVANAAFALAKESLRITAARFKQGLAKTSDLLDREASATNAELRLLAAKYDLAVALSELEFVR